MGAGVTVGMCSAWLFSFCPPQDPSIARKPVAAKPKRVQKGNERVPASRKKLRKDEGLRPGEALMKLKQVWGCELRCGTIPAPGTGSFLTLHPLCAHRSSLCCL